MITVYLSTDNIDRVKVQDNTKMVLRKGAVLSFTGMVERGSVYRRNESISSMIYAVNANNVEVIGEGDSIINGRGSSLINEREEALFGIILFDHCKNVKIKNLTLINSLYWGIKLDNCENVEIDNVKVVSKWGRSNCGIEINSCNNVKVKNSTFDVNDTCVVLRTGTCEPCEKITVEKCVFSSIWGSFKIGADSFGDFNDIIMRDCIVRKAEGCFLKITPTDGGSINNLLVENIDVKHSTGPVFIVNGIRNYRYVNEQEVFSSISNVTLRKIRADVYISYTSLSEGVGDCFFISGNKKRRIKNVTIEDCQLNMPGGKKDKIKFDVLELADEYPEYYILGVPPASGIFVRHVDDLVIKDVQVNLKENDCREKIVLDDVTESKIY